MTESPVKISFGIIVLNGEPYTKYCIRSLYSHAHEIIISEGACIGARSISSSDGHSRDGTLELLRAIKREEDPDKKIIIVTAEDEGHSDGFWPGEKHEQCRAFAKRATGNYLWQVDIDEFYKDEDITKVKKLLESDKSVKCISFKPVNFWGGFEYYVESWYFKRHLNEIYRVFKWGEGYEYSNHRPPTVLDENGNNLKDIKLINAGQTEKMGILMYHYSFVFPKQVFTKSEYYTNSEWLSLNANDWARNNFIKISKPFRLFIIPEYPGWIRRFEGEHPFEILKLADDIKSKKLLIESRNTTDIENLLDSHLYNLGVFFLNCYEPVDRAADSLYRFSVKKIKKLIYAIRIF